MPMWLQIIIVAATFSGLLFAGFGIWVKSRESLAHADGARAELEHEVAAQRRALEVAVQRIQNLETIVTSQDWNAVQGGTAPGTSEHRAIAQPPLRLDDLEGLPDAEQVARTARRIKT